MKLEMNKIQNDNFDRELTFLISEVNYRLDEWHDEFDKYNESYTSTKYDKFIAEKFRRMLAEKDIRDRLSGLYTFKFTPEGIVGRRV